jgi:L-aspartate oxidase
MREAVSGPAPRFGLPHEGAVPAASEDEIWRLAWENCGILRHRETLEKACDKLELDSDSKAVGAHALAAQNLRDVALLIARAALARRESRGAHYRADYQDKSAEFEKHSIAHRDCEIEFRSGHFAPSHG